MALVTRNRPTSLERTLCSLRAQSCQPWEVVISDDSDTDQKPDVVRLARFFTCKYIPGPRRGLYANRNHVALACLGTHIRTMDDDHEFPEYHIALCMQAADQDPGAIWVIGECYPGFSPADLPPACPGQLHPRGFSVVPRDPQDCWSIADGATIYPNKIFKSGVRYFEDFSFGAAYLELGSRLHWLGYRIRHLQGTYIIHRYDADNRSFSDPQVDLSSRVFAMLCHSFKYQPRLGNMSLSLLELGKELSLHPSLSARSIAAGLRAFSLRSRPG